MFLTAQHVRSPFGHEGINVFRYQHGPYVWHGLPPVGIPDQNPGALAMQAVPVPAGGNQVRSYLDIIAPDEVSWQEIRPAFMVFMGQVPRQPLPWAGLVGRCLFRMGMDHGVALTWPQEAAALFNAAFNLFRVGVVG